jgi:hypothetical protein
MRRFRLSLAAISAVGLAAVLPWSPTRDMGQPHWSRVMAATGDDDLARGKAWWAHVQVLADDSMICVRRRTWWASSRSTG